MDSGVINATIQALTRTSTGWEWNAFLSRLERLARPEQLRQYWLPAQYACTQWILAHVADPQLRHDAITIYMHRHRNFFTEQEASRAFVLSPTEEQVKALEERQSALRDEVELQQRHLRASVLSMTIAREEEHVAALAPPPQRMGEEASALLDRLMGEASEAYGRTGTLEGVIEAITARHPEGELDSLISVVGGGGDD
jgi:hypothetical protein